MAENILEYLFQTNIDGLQESAGFTLRQQDADLLRQFFFMGAYNAIMLQRTGLKGLNAAKPDEVACYTQNQMLGEIFDVIGTEEGMDDEYEDEEQDSDEDDEEQEAIPPNRNLH
ncbi:hypothetical protein [Achromobacter phage Motura]|uniref:Uncharacterized protein n=1 Tax=Achromobacter phage Motura TaxID=2591403 RepID=A0A514CSH6_9CAUD|nr:hypothetical protein H1O15_gp017 [Achromobacter phage Motura]QDH83425.1 hypothetical protein [Achromobacter phage Motura]